MAKFVICSLYSNNEMFLTRINKLAEKLSFLTSYREELSF